MAINALIAQGVAPVGRDVAGLLIQKRNQDFSNALATSQNNRAQTAFDQAQQDRAQQQSLSKQTEDAKQAAAEAKWLLSPNVQDKVGALHQLPHITSALQQQGIDTTQFTPDQVVNLAQNVLAKASSFLGQGPEEPKFQSVADGGNLVQTNAPGGPTVAYQAPEKQKPLGTLYQYVDPKTNKPVFGTAEEAKGQTPYNKPTSFQAGSGDLTEGGIDLAAQDYRLNGKLPSGISRIPGASLKIINRAADQAASTGDTAQEAVLRRQGVAAAKTAISKISTQKALVGAYEKTAAKNIDLALSLSDKLDRSGSPLINKGIIAFRQGVTGDPETAAFVNALTAARTEYAKVLSGATGSAGITDSARHEANDLFSKISNAETLRAVFGVAKQEMGNRMSSFDDQLGEINQGLSGKPPVAAQPGAPAVSPTKTVNFSDLP